MKVGIISLGCSKNLVDSENLLGLLKSANVELVQNPKDADAIIINTCGFIQSAKEEAINTILEMAEYKNKGLKKLIVMGCLSTRYQDDLTKDMPEVDRFISIKEYSKIGDILTKELGVKIPNTYGKNPRVLSAKPWMAYLRIADGCDNKCSYCAIPLIRGPYISMQMEKLIEEAKGLAKNGVKELNLIAQDTTRYGIDLYDERKLGALLKELNKIEELHWIRVLYMYPDEIDDALLDDMASCNKVIPYFDIPIQHASNKMLEAMNRRGSIEHIYKIVNRIRQKFETPVLRTTLIVGFPNETMDDIYDMSKMIEELRWDRLGVFTYSHEEDTPAWDDEDNVSEEEKEKRLDSIMSLQQTIAKLNNEKWINKTLEVLVERYDGLRHIYYGRSVLSAPDGVDGEVLFKSDLNIELGSFVNVKITGADYYDLKGELQIKN